jgi:hypothetical protein
MLRGDAPERQIAAAIVLGELGARDAAVIDGLGALLAGAAPLQRHALAALGRLGAKKSLPQILPLLGTRDEGVRAAAVAAVVAFGTDAVPAVRQRLDAAEADERRALEEVLGRLGGRESLSALLVGLHAADVEGARAAALAMRQRIKEADARERRGYLAEVTQLLAHKRTQASPAAAAAAIKIVGFLEDPGSIPALLGYATSPKQPEAVRQEALIALRFAANPAPKTAAGDDRKKKSAKTAGGARAAAQKNVADKLLGVAEEAPLAVARVALYSLAGFELGAPLVRRLGKLAGHAESERALLAIERLAQVPAAAAGADAAAALGAVLLETDERARAEAAGAALAAREDAAPALARALLAAPDTDRATMLARVLRPRARQLDRALGRAILDAALARLDDTAGARGKPAKPASKSKPPPAPTPAPAGAPGGWEPYLQVAREIDAAGAAAGLRALGDKLRKSGKTERALAVLRVLGRSNEAAPDDGYALAALELGQGRRDEAFTIFAQLLERGYDVAAAVRGDRSLDLAARYDIGFHFAERRAPLGEELLSAVADAAGRSKLGRKLGQMARAKLKRHLAVPRRPVRRPGRGRRRGRHLRIVGRRRHLLRSRRCLSAALRARSRLRRRRRIRGLDG